MNHWLTTWMVALPWQLVAGGFAALLALVAAILGFRRSFPGPSEIELRLERTVGRVDSTDHHEEKSKQPFSIILRPLIWMVRPNKAEELSRLRQNLLRAGLRRPHAMEIFLSIKILLAVVLTILFLQINSQMQRQLTFPLDMAVAVWICGAGFFLPHLWLRSKIQTRQLYITNALPDAMDLMVTCVEAGLSLDASVARVSQEIGLASPILGTELNLTFLEIQAGVRRADAFRRLAERTGVDELHSLSAMLIQTEMFGTSVARAIRVHSEGMRIRRMQRAEEKAAMVGVKMTIPLILCILPALIAVVIGPAVISIFTKFMNGGH